MHFNKHSNLEGKHSFLSASKYHWINYDQEKLVHSYQAFTAAQEGTELHELAAMLIRKRIPLPKKKETLNLYVNDAIGYLMEPEKVLYYSQNAFGTADAISFRKDPKSKRDILRIHDLKTGEIPAHMEQLMIYAAYFCLEYSYNLRDIDIELRIYQSNQVLCHSAKDEFKEGVSGYDMIEAIIKKIIAFDKLIDEMRDEE